MKYQYIRAFIVLIAGLLAVIINMKMGREVTTSLLIVLIVLLVFYFLSTLVVEILQRSIEKNDLTEGNAEQNLESADSIEAAALTEEENVNSNLDFDDEE